METSLMGKDMTRDDYQDYIDKIVNIFRISDSYSSILFDLKINNYQDVLDNIMKEIEMVRKQRQIENDIFQKQIELLDKGHYRKGRKK